MHKAPQMFSGLAARNAQRDTKIVLARYKQIQRIATSPLECTKRLLHSGLRARQITKKETGLYRLMRLFDKHHVAFCGNVAWHYLENVLFLEMPCFIFCSPRFILMHKFRILSYLRSILDISPSSWIS